MFSTLIVNMPRTGMLQANSMKLGEECSKNFKIFSKRKVKERCILLILSMVMSRPLVKSAYPKNSFLISQQKHMLWVLKRTVSMRRFF